MISKNFKEEEFACKCCGKVIINQELVDVLQDVRDHFNKPVTITSAFRCYEHNKEVGGKSYSKHLTGEGADIIVKDTDASDVAEYLEEEHPSRYGIGQYERFTHIDVRTSKARWITLD